MLFTLFAQHCYCNPLFSMCTSWFIIVDLHNIPPTRHSLSPLVINCCRPHQAPSLHDEQNKKKFNPAVKSKENLCTVKRWGAPIVHSTAVAWALVLYLVCASPPPPMWATFWLWWRPGCCPPPPTAVYKYDTSELGCCLLSGEFILLGGSTTISGGAIRDSFSSSQILNLTGWYGSSSPSSLFVFTGLKTICINYNIIVV